MLVVRLGRSCRLRLIGRCACFLILICESCVVLDTANAWYEHGNDHDTMRCIYYAEQLCDLGAGLCSARATVLFVIYAYSIYGCESFSACLQSCNSSTLFLEIS